MNKEKESTKLIWNVLDTFSGKQPDIKPKKTKK